MDRKPAKSKTNRLHVFCKKNGFALTIMLCTVVMLLVIGVGVMSFGQQGRRLAVQTSSMMVARCSADAGLTKALYEMNEKLKITPWDNTTLPEAIDEALSNSDAIYSYSVTGDLNVGHVVKSTGKYGIRQRTVSCSLPLKGLFEYAIFGDEYIHLKNGGSIDWYNNDANDGSLQVGTNNTLADSIVLKPGTVVNGDLVIGAGGDPDTVINDAGATVTGNTFIMPQEYDLPQITVPEWLEAMPSGGAIKNSVIINSSGKYNEIDLANNKVITIDGEVTLYIIGDIILDNSAELQILDKEDVSLTIYVGGNIEVKNSGVINNLSGDATKLTIYGLETCESIILKNDTDFYGAIYAPNADIIMMNSGDVYGSVVGNSIEQKNSADFIYDAALKKVSVEDEGVRFVVQQWHEE